MPAKRSRSSAPSRPLLLYISDTEALGGAEGYLQTLFTHADQERFRVGLLIPARPATRPLAEAAQSCGVAVEALRYVHHEGLSPGAVWAITQQLRRLQPAIVHFVLPAPRRCAEAMIAAAIARVARRIATFQLVTPVPPFGRVAGSQRALNRRAQYATLHEAVAVSGGNWRLLVEQYGLSRQHLHTIPNGVDTEAFAPRPPAPALRVAWGIPPDAPLIGMAARLAHTKGQAVLFDALPLVWKHIPAAHVVVAGQGPQEAELRRQAAALAQAQQVHFLGQQHDMPAFLAALDVFALPSFVEGLPFALLEAMAIERAVVASAIDGTVEAVQHGRSGLLVPPGNAEALAAALVQVLRDGDTRLRLGKAARARVELAFSQRAMLERTFALYC